MPRVCLPGTPLRAPATRPTCRAPCCTARRIHQLHDLLTRRCPAASTSRAPRAAAHVLSASAAARWAACSAPCRTPLRAPRHLPYRAALCCLPASDRLQADRRAARLAVADLLRLSPRPSLPVFTDPHYSLLLLLCMYISMPLNVSRFACNLLVLYVSRQLQTTCDIYMFLVLGYISCGS